jgi:hypothetical protein
MTMSNEPEVIYLHDRDHIYKYEYNGHMENTVQWSETRLTDNDYQYIRSTTGLFNFLMWFRDNGEKFIDMPVEKMIEIYLKSLDEKES